MTFHEQVSLDNCLKWKFPAVVYINMRSKLWDDKPDTNYPLRHLQIVRFLQSYKFSAGHTVWHGPNKLGYDFNFHVCGLYDDNTYWIEGYDASQYSSIICLQCVWSISAATMKSVVTSIRASFNVAFWLVVQ